MGWERVTQMATIGSFGIAFVLFTLVLWPKIMNKGEWLSKVALGLVIIGIVLSGILYLGSLSSNKKIVMETAGPKWAGEKKTIAGKTFRNERVPLDGFSYVNCKFVNVTLVYNGEAPYDLVGNTFVGSRWIETESPSIEAFVTLLDTFGFIGKDVSTPTRRQGE